MSSVMNVSVLENSLYKNDKHIGPGNNSMQKIINKLSTIKRKIVQMFATLLANLNIGGLMNGTIYQGRAKGLCSPGLNCYSCPAATGACPLGSLQNTLGGIKGKWNTYVIGSLLLYGAALGRWICGWLCPFGLLQELLYKIPSPKCTASLKKISWLKYVVFAGLVILFPIITAIDLGVGISAFCKYLCPQGTIAGSLLFIANEQLRSLAGRLFWVKFIVLIGILTSSVFVFRPFCRVLCPLGVIYGLFNKIALLRMKVDENHCTSCSSCEKACPMKLKPVKECNSTECIRCGKCVSACQCDAIHFQIAGKTLGSKKEVKKETKLEN